MYREDGGGEGRGGNTYDVGKCGELINMELHL